jgi:hypothetical protein
VTSVSARAYAAIPGYNRLSDALDRLRDHATTLAVSTVQTADEIRAEVHEQLVSGQPVPDGIGARLAAAELDQQHRQTEARFLGWQAGSQRVGIYGQIQSEREQLVRQHADQALKVLADELDDIITVVIAADPVLGGVTTAEAALRAGDQQAAAWRSLSDAVTRYDAVRTAQHQVLISAGHEVARCRPDCEDAGFIRNPIAFDPRWQARIEGEEQALSDAVIVARSPWPAPRPTRGSAHWPTNNRHGYLRWLAAGPAEPWLPTRSALRRALDRLATAEQEAAAERARPTGPSPEREAVAAGIESRARFRH